MHRSLAVFHAILWVSGSLVSGPVAGEPRPSDGRPALRVEQRGSLSEIWVESVLPDGSASRKKLRETTAPVTPGATGGDPARRALFATWSEAVESWSAYSRDAGATWSVPRRLVEQLRLRDGAVAPGDAMPHVPEGFRLPPAGGLFIVQLRTVSLPEWREAIEDVGAEVLRFFPLQSHIVRTPRPLVPRLLDLDFVRRVEPYEPWHRLERELRAWVGQDAGVAPRRMRVNVLAFEWGPEGKDRIARAAEAMGAGVEAAWPNGHIVELTVDRDQLRRLAAHDDVMWVDRWGAPEYDMNVVRQDSGAEWLESEHGMCGQGVRGEVLDSGCDVDHQDFDGIMTHGSNSIGLFDGSHGTSSFGVVFGNGDRDGDGQANATGHMPCAGQGICADTDFLGDRFEHTQELKEDPYFASFQTNSWGSPRTLGYTSKSHDMDDIIWQLDIAILQSQSNSGTQSSRPEAWAKNVISVGGISHYNTLTESDDRWTTASIGPAEDGRIKPDVHYWYDSVYTTANNNGYTNFGGTSAAAPTAAGVVGLMVQMWSENVWGTDPSGSTVFERQPHFGTIKALAVNNAQQYAFSGTTHNLTRVHQGWGRPDARIARERADESFVVDQDQPLEVGEAVFYLLNVRQAESELKATLVYPDPPGTTSASMHRINDLDLRVISPSGTTYHGNVGLDASTESSPGGDPNDVDTVENVFVADPEAGTWTVEVSAPEINQDAHPETAEDDAVFALVVTGAAAGSGISTPGEASSRYSSQQLRVTGFDESTGVMSLSYSPACSATDHVIEYGTLTPEDIASYAWSGQECGVGNDGTYEWDTSAAPESLFFVIVGQTIDVEGSYGLDGTGSERPEDDGLHCPLPQDLSNRCD